MIVVNVCNGNKVAVLTIDPINPLTPVPAATGRAKTHPQFPVPAVTKHVRTIAFPTLPEEIFVLLLFYCC